MWQKSGRDHVYGCLDLFHVTKNLATIMRVPTGLRKVLKTFKIRNFMQSIKGVLLWFIMGSINFKVFIILLKSPQINNLL